MKKNTQSSFYLALMLGAAFVCFLLQLKPTENHRANKVSGAFEALQLRGAAQTYPMGKIPAKAHFAAWETLKQMDNTQERGGNASEWEALGPYNRGGRTLALAFNPQNANTIYVGSASGGLWRSYTAGVGPSAWKQVPIPLPVLSVSFIEFVPNDSMTMYVGTGEVYNIEGVGTGAAHRATRGSAGMGILKTTDGGQTWTKSLDWSYNQEHGVWAIKIAPTNHDIVYAATTDGTYKSIDAGASWTKVHDVKMGTDLLVHPQDEHLVLVACGNLGSVGQGIYRSTNGGDTWAKIGSDLPVGFQGKIQMNYAPSNPDIVYASFGNGFSTAEGATNLCRSTDFGQNWEVRSTVDYSIFQGWFAHDVAVDPQNENNLALIGVECWRSTDGGLTVERISNGGIGPQNAPSGGQPNDPKFVHSDAHDVQWHPSQPNTYYITSDGGINRTLDGGETFELLTGGYQTAQFYNGISCSPTDSTFFIGGLQDNGTNLWNGDFTWTNVFGGDGSWTAVHPTNPSTYYLSYQYLNSYKISSNGQQYMNIPSPGNSVFIAPFIISPSDGQTMYAGSTGIAKSTNGGNSWSLMNNSTSLDGNNPVLAMEMAAENPAVLYAATVPSYPFFATNRGNLFVSTNGGVSFFKRTGIIPDRFIMDIAVDPIDERTAYVTTAGFGAGHVFKTNNYGLVWEDITANLPDAPTNAIIVDPIFPNHLYVGNDLGVFASVDGGEIWFPFMEGLPEAVMVFDLKISASNRKLRIGSHGNGAYQRDLLPGDFVKTKSAFIKDSKLNVYPNPVDANQTLITFSSKKTGKASLSLINLEGKVLGSKTIQTQADNSIPWPFGVVSQKGQCFVRLEMEGGQLTKVVYVE